MASKLNSPHKSVAMTSKRSPHAPMLQFGGIPNELLLSDVDFDKLHEIQRNPIEPIAETRYNYCPECRSPMELSANEYKCQYCGFMRSNDLDTDKTSSGAACGTLRTGNGAVYYFNGEYPKTQHKMVLCDLIKLHKAYTGPAIPNCALVATADQYNLIQRDVIDYEYDDVGNVQRTKKFVHRGNIKDEVLATILYYECIRAGCIRHKVEIAKFMNLSIEGFARGEDIIRTLIEKGNISLPIEVEPVREYAERYMSALSITNDSYIDFIVDLVQVSEKYRLGMSSHLSSKVVGAIWIIIQRCGHTITWKELESATGNTKKNTFMKFYKLVYSNLGVFTEVFARYNIPVRAGT